jgi:hypothetical protein
VSNRPSQASEKKNARNVTQSADEAFREGGKDSFIRTEAASGEQTILLEKLQEK